MSVSESPDLGFEFLDLLHHVRAGVLGEPCPLQLDDGAGTRVVDAQQFPGAP
ncbi:hypothetical protein [Pseudonocardia sp. NPDC046786]|uniref:hypothetical protein n=1 Tax=Pseudonocardia sp. NPDC046786 TaxID=3155471 RepID=UPI0033C13B31